MTLAFFNLHMLCTVIVFVTNFATSYHLSLPEDLYIRKERFDLYVSSFLLFLSALPTEQPNFNKPGVKPDCCEGKHVGQGPATSEVLMHTTLQTPAVWNTE